MRKSIFAVAATLMAAAAFTACNVNDDIYDAGNEPVRFTAGIDRKAVNAPAGSRAAGATWGNDAIGIFMVEGAATHYANREYTTDSDGTFTAAEGSEMYYPQNNAEVTFTAYYPYQSGAKLDTPIAVEIAADQTEADIQPTFDLLWSTGATGQKSTATTPVDLTFAHKLAKIVMNVKSNESVTEPFEDMTVSISGMYTQNTFDLSTGTLGEVPTTEATITPRAITAPTGFKASYDAIIMPYSNYEADAVTVTFTLASGDAYTWKLKAADAVFEPGNEYTYAVTLTKHGVQLQNCTITPWTTEERKEVTAE